MNGHASPVVSAQAGPSRLKANNGGAAAATAAHHANNNGNGSASAAGPSTASPSPSSSSSTMPPSFHPAVPSAGSYYGGSSPGMNYSPMQNAQMMGYPGANNAQGNGYYQPQHYAHYISQGQSPGGYPVRMPSNGGHSQNGSASTGGPAGSYSRQNSYQHHQQQQHHHHHQQHHMASYDYNNTMHHHPANGAGPSRYPTSYPQYNPYYAQPVYGPGGGMQPSPYPVYQPNTGYAAPQPMYYDPSNMYAPMNYGSPAGSMAPNAVRSPYSPYVPQPHASPYPYVIPTPELSHPIPTGSLQPQTPASSHVSPVPTSQALPVTITNPPPPPPRESDQPPQPPPPITRDDQADSKTEEAEKKDAQSSGVPIFASVMRSTPIVLASSEIDAAKEVSSDEMVEQLEDVSLKVAQDEQVEKQQVKSETDDFNGFQVDEAQSYQFARGLPGNGSDSPAVLYSLQLKHNNREHKDWSEWRGQLSLTSAKRIGDEPASPSRDQSKAVSFAKGARLRVVSSEGQLKFGDLEESDLPAHKVEEEVILPQPESAKEEAAAHAPEPTKIKTEDSVQGTQEKPESKNENDVLSNSVPAKPTSSESDPAFTSTLSETPTTTAPALAPAPPSVKAAPKSWAALLRTNVPTPPKSAPEPVTTSSEIDPIAYSNEGMPAASSEPQPPSVSSANNKPRPSGYAAAAAAGPAWGAAGRSTEIDLGKLLSEGLMGSSLSGTTGLTSVPRGLINTGNMCFANSILQVLAYCNPFTVLLQELSKRMKADLGGRTRLLEAMMLFLKEFAAAEINEASLNGAESTISAGARPQVVSSSGIAKSGEAFVPTYVYEAMKENKRFDTMRRGHQEDAEEFMGFFLETLHEEMLYLFSRCEARMAKGLSKDSTKATTAKTEGADDEREVSRPVSPSAGRDDGWLEVGKKQKINVVRATTSRESAISRIFGGKLRSVLRTPGQKDSVTLEPYQPLQLDISSPQVNTITDALLHLNEPETISGVYSASKGMNVDATKTVYLETVPPILTLHLKRFLYDPIEMRVVKKGKAVAYGPELIIPSSIISPARRPQGDLRYKLFGVVYHHGSSATGGHYTACVLKQDGKGWLHLDDELVENVEGDTGVYVTRDAALQGDAGTVGRSMRSKCAYLLFYARV